MDWTAVRIKLDSLSELRRRTQVGQQDNLDPLHRSNLLLALNVEPFRRVLAARVLQDIAQRL